MPVPDSWLTRRGGGTGDDPLGELAVAVVRLAMAEARRSAAARAWLEQVRADILDDASPRLSRHLRTRATLIPGGEDVPLDQAPRSGKGSAPDAPTSSAEAPATHAVSSEARHFGQAQRPLAPAGG